MVLAVEIAKLRPDQQNQQHQYSDNHMGQMETSDGEIKRAVWAGVELVRLVQPLDQLHAHEDETKHDAATQPERLSTPAADACALLTPPNDDAAQQQDDRIRTRKFKLRKVLRQERAVAPDDEILIAEQ